MLEASLRGLKAHIARLDLVTTDVRFRADSIVTTQRCISNARRVREKWVRETGWVRAGLAQAVRWWSPAASGWARWAADSVVLPGCEGWSTDGRSLSGAGDSPQLRIRLPDELRAALTRRAAHQGVTVSELARNVLAAAETRPENRVQLELHRAVLGNFLADPGRLREVAQRNLERMRGSVRGTQAQGWLDEWAELVKQPGPRLVEAFLGEDEHSIDLRQVSPFVGALTQDERRAAIGRAHRQASS